MYLDCDTTPPLRSGNTPCGVEMAKKLALTRLKDVKEGQIGIYQSYLGDFVGYAIKYAGEEPYFEPAEIV